MGLVLAVTGSGIVNVRRNTLTLGTGILFGLIGVAMMMRSGGFVRRLWPLGARKQP
jgi:hypothetical protein